ncbi:MAG: glycosyl hydrolase [Clostridia bacterium]|nr:glycosyl hydrolase [Clostridia bacterium]
MKRKIRISCILGCALIGIYLITGGADKGTPNAQQENKDQLLKKDKNKQVDAINHERLQTQFSAWTVYWHTEGVVEEIQLVQDNIENLCYFAAYFDHKNKLVIPEETTEIFKVIKQDFYEKKWTHYMTVVNDKVYEDKSISLKDTQLLYQLFSNEEVMNRHIQDILNLAIQNGYNGIEIDYEAIRMDLELWNLFIDFCNKLYKEADTKHLKLRVLLESSTPFEKLTFSEGPEYVMMCYNLYGMHSEPGPKANKAFIESLIQQMSVLPGEKNFAIATGGFDWSVKGTVTALTEIEAYSLAVEYSANIIRDPESQALVYHYEDLDKIQHEVWYADTVTFNHWISVIETAGDYGISVWRLGGNRSSTY